MENKLSSSSNPSPDEQSIRSGDYDSSTLSNSSLAENATLFATPASTPQNQVPPSGAQAANASPSESQFLTLIGLVVLALSLLGGLGFALFNVDAICEPLGLCDKEESDGELESAVDAGTRGSSESTLSGSESTDSKDPSQQYQEREGIPPVIPPTQSTQNQPDLLPDRDEALW